MKNEFVFWDFGGQKEYHLYHQLFLSSGALYILVVDLYKFSSTITSSTEKGDIDGNHHTDQIDRWLDTLSSYLSENSESDINDSSTSSGNVGIIVVGNKKQSIEDEKSVLESS